MDSEGEDSASGYEIKKDIPYTHSSHAVARAGRNPSYRPAPSLLGLPRHRHEPHRDCRTAGDARTVLFQDNKILF
jgi:hypothetical protein